MIYKSAVIVFISALILLITWGAHTQPQQSVMAAPAQPREPALQVTINFTETQQ